MAPTSAERGSIRKAISVTVNGETVRAHVEPRLQLADFLREEVGLTGTHLGCEHGVCGACTVEIDGVPARSCITYAVACDGARVRTIEGYDGDAVMAELREAFSAEHALQCGYCTPGMLATARDIVLRLPQADEARIRKELAGNLCRCTGYVGIVRAIQRVIAERNASGKTSSERASFDSAALRSGRTEGVGGASASGAGPSFDSAALRSGRTEEAGGVSAPGAGPSFDSAALRSGRTGEVDGVSAPGAGRSFDSAALRSGRTGEVGGTSDDVTPGASPHSVRPERRREAPESKGPPATRSSASARAGEAVGSQPTLRESFVVAHPRATVWAFFGRLDEVTPCLPGATVVGTPSPAHVDVRLRVKLGPIAPEFAGGADVARDPASYAGTIRAAATDARSGSITRGEIRYVLTEERSGAATRVDIEVGYTLTGPLAQFGRSSIVRDIAGRMTAAFARNVEARLDRSGVETDAGTAPTPAAELDAGSLVLSALWNRIRAFFGFRAR